MIRAVFSVLTGISTLFSISAQDIHPNMRSLDNNAALAADTGDHTWCRALKLIPLSKEQHIQLSFGGEIREQVRYYYHQNHGDTPGYPDEDLYLLQRFLLHADLTVGKHFRVFAQAGSMHASWKNSLAHTDKDNLTVMQAFAEVKTAGPVSFQLRVGRQDMSYANERMLGTREGPNVRQTFDGVKVTLAGRRIKADVFVVAPMLYEYGMFDNAINRDVQFFGTYGSVAGKKQGTLDVYYLGSHRSLTTAVNETAEEWRHTFGMRHHETKGAFYYDAKLEVQTGVFGNKTIGAWQVAGFAGVLLKDLPMQPKVQFRINSGSGDRDSSDNRMNLFRPLSTKSAVHDLLANGNGNLIVLSPEAEFRLSRQLILTLRYFIVRRMSAEDGIYTVDMERMARDPDPAAESWGMCVDRGITEDLAWNPTKHFGLLFSAGYFVAGDYVKHTGLGKSQLPMALKLTYRF